MIESELIKLTVGQWIFTVMAMLTVGTFIGAWLGCMLERHLADNVDKFKQKIWGEAGRGSHRPVPEGAR